MGWFAFKDLMWPLVVNTEQETMPLSAALAKLQGQFSANYPKLMAASLLALNFLSCFCPVRGDSDGIVT